ncbi:MAG: hypothetical protein QOJ38_449 [Solirubrobacterales bacterium]|jgi:hypothetical protein|nr:hypothetical protein [Solirubrobacterales bacterium]
MRKALNENPAVQIALIGVLLAVGALFLMMRGGGGSAKPPSAPAAQAPAPASAGASASGATATTAAPAPVSTSVTAPSSGFEAGPGLPRRVLASYRADDVVVVLVTRDGGIDDELVRGSAASLRSTPGVSLFVTDSRHVARYSSITQGVAVDRTPALIVIKPQRLSNGVPQAEVKYGFRSARSIAQAVRDAAYSGPERSYDP